MSEEPEGRPEEEQPKTYRMRRAPKYLPFAITGLVLGVLIGLVLGQLPAQPLPGRQTYTDQGVTGYFVASLGLLGTLLGLGVALLMERRRR